MQKKEKIDVWMTPQLKAWLRQRQQHLGIPMSQIARSILEEECARFERQQLGLEEASFSSVSRDLQVVRRQVALIARMQGQALLARGPEGRAIVEEAREYANRIAETDDLDR